MKRLRDLKKRLQYKETRDKGQNSELAIIEKKLEELQSTETQVANHMVRSSKTMFRFWFFGLIIVGIGVVLYKSIDMVFLVFMALIIAISMEAVVDFFAKKLHRGISIGLTYLLLIVAILGGVLFIVPFIAEQLSAILQVFVLKAQAFQVALSTKGLPAVIQDITWLPKYFRGSLLQRIQDPKFYTEIQNDLQKNLSTLIGTSTTYAKQIGGVAFNFFSRLAGVIGKFAIVLTLAVMFSIEKTAVTNFIAGITGVKNRERMTLRVEKIYKKLGLWLKGQLILCGFIGIAMLLATIVMSLFGLEIPQKGSLALIAGLTELVPYLGPILGGLPAVLVVGLHNGLAPAFVMVGVVFGIQRLENNILVPLVMNKTLGVNPVVIFLSMLVGGIVMGFAGILLAVPIAVVVTMFVEK